jgi:putative restriction endonuclease
MPPTDILSQAELYELMVETIYENGWQVQQLQKTKPFRLIAYSNREVHPLIIYIWNLTHGGGPRDKAEYRIQVHQREALEYEKGWKTLILGWRGKIGVFAGFDYHKHQAPGYSSSIQIKDEALQNAYKFRIATYDKGNQEIAIAFHPSLFIEYIRNLEVLHTLGDVELLNQIAEQEGVAESDLPTQATPERQSTIQTINRKIRDVSYKARVLGAYQNTCAFCGIQLKLVDAAHIMPVSHALSTDETANGIALCALHHRAYDRMLVTFDESYQIKINELRINHLKAEDLGAGADKFVQGLRSMIILPATRTDRPYPEYIAKANTLRGWS